MKKGAVEKFLKMSGVTFCPISFSTRKQEMLTHSVKVLEKHYVRIDKRFDKLITSLRTAKTTINNAMYDKQASSYSDLCESWQTISLLLSETND
jgi:hypothetical protein